MTLAIRLIAKTIFHFSKVFRHFSTNKRSWTEFCTEKCVLSINNLQIVLSRKMSNACLLSRSLRLSWLRDAEDKYGIKACIRVYGYFRRNSFGYNTRLNGSPLQMDVIELRTRPRSLCTSVAVPLSYKLFRV